MTGPGLEVLGALPVHPVPPHVDRHRGVLVDGAVQRPQLIDVDALHSLTPAAVTDDFRCLEGWSVPGLHWEGVMLTTVLEAAGADPDAACVQISAGDFSTLLSRAEAAQALLALRLGDAPLTQEHGGPVRLLIPGGACYTSVKWVDHIEVLRAATPDRVAVNDSMVAFARTRAEDARARRAATSDEPREVKPR